MKNYKNRHISRVLAGATFAGALLATGAISTGTAHAATTPAPNANVTQQQTQSVSSLKSAQDQSRANYASASAAQSSAQANVNSANSVINQASAANSQLNSDTNFESAAASNASNADSLANAAKSLAASQGIDVNAVSNAQSAVNAAQSNVNSASNTAASTATNLSNAQSANTSAQNTVTSAQNAVSHATKSVSDAQHNLDVAQSNVDNLGNMSAALSAAQNRVNTAQSAKTSADNQVNSAQNTVNNAQSKLNSDQSALNNANQTVPSNGDNSSNGNLKLDDQFNNLLRERANEYAQKDPGAINNAVGRQIANKYDTLENNLMHQWNDNLPTTYLQDNDKIPATHTFTNLGNGNTYESDPTLRKILIKDGYQEYDTYEPSDPHNLYAPWVKKVVWAENNRGISANASINATNYLLELINPIREAHNLAPLTTDANAINKGVQAIPQIDTAFENADHTGQAVNTNAFQGQYGVNNFDTSSGDGYILSDIQGSNLGGFGAKVDAGTLPDHGWVSVDNLHRAIFDYANTELEKHQDTGLIGGANFLLNPTVQSIAVQVGKNGGLYILMFNPQAPSTNTSALQSAINTDKQTLTQAKTALSQAKVTQTQAANNLAAAKQAYANLAKGAKDPTVLQNQLAQAKTNLQKSQQLLNTAQTVLTQAQNKASQTAQTLSQTQTANTQAQNALKTAQSQLASAKANLQTVTKNNAALLKALNAQTKAHDIYNKAVAQVKADQDKVNKLAPLAATAKVQLPALQKALDEANAALATAKANLITDAKVYGDIVKVNNPAAIHAHQNLPSLSLANQMADDPTQNEVAGIMLTMAEMPGDTIPTGTTVAWANVAKAESDAKTPGTYTEDVIVTFPDGSTVTKIVTLTVLPALTGTVTTLPNGWKVINGHVVNAQGQIVPGYEVINGAVIKVGNNGENNGSYNNSTNSVNNATENGTANEGTATTGNIVKATYQATNQTRSSLDNGKLPQTGNNNVAGVLALGVMSFASMFGLAVRRKEN